MPWGSTKAAFQSLKVLLHHLVELGHIVLQNTHGIDELKESSMNNLETRKIQLIQLSKTSTT